jgi:peptide/nickel transport system substrate-binding protein
MNSKARLFIVSLVVVTAMLMGVVAAPGMTNVAKAQGKTLTVAFAQEPDTLNTWYSNMAFGQWVWFLTQANLWDYDNKLQPVPVLVEELPTAANGGISKDGLTLTVKLKKDLKWSDGEPLTADDVVFTIQMAQDKANNFTISGPLTDGTVVSAKAVDAQTVEVVTKTPQFPENIFGVANLIVLPKHIYGPIYEKDKTLEKADANQNPTAFSGPFVLKEWKRGESLTFEPNPNYARGKVGIDSLTIRVFPDPETANAAFVVGDVDVVVNLNGAEIQKIKEQLKDAGDAGFVGVYGSYRESLWINQRTKEYPREGHPALKDKRVRQAIRLAINRKAIIDDLMYGNPTASESMWGDTPYFNPAAKPIEYDAEAAAKLLDEAGWVMGADGVRESKGVKDVADGTKLELIHDSTVAQHRKDKQAVIQQDLAKVGIKTVIKNYDPTLYFGSFQDGAPTKTGAGDLSEYANNTVTTNPANVRTFECDNITSEKNPGGQNYIGWCNEEFDKLQKETENALDPEAAKKAAFRMQEIMYEEVPIIQLYTLQDNYAYRTAKFGTAPNFGAGITNQWYDILNWDIK